MVVVPWATQDATERENLFLILMFVALCSSLNILMGYTGYVNFAHIAFFGLGGYIGFYFMSQQGWSLYASMVAASPARLVLCPGDHRHQRGGACAGCEHEPVWRVHRHVA
jgi:branched-chain amino acid transport system permease protein